MLTTSNDDVVKTLYEDELLLAVSKPAGMVVHPTYKNKAGTLLDVLTSSALPRPSIVGRLDKWTSGIVLVAKNASAHAFLQRALSSPEAEKIYLAIVVGLVPQAEGTIELPLRVSAADRRRVVVDAHGSPAFTRFERLDTFEAGGCAASLLRCRPVTGRRHQIRVHLAESGWSIVGDPLYGATRPACDSPAFRTALEHLSGQALHSWTVAFRHPVSGDRINLEAPITAAMGRLLALFDRHGGDMLHSARQSGTR